MILRVSPDYGYIVIDVLLTFFVLMWMAKNVGNGRKKYGVKFPDMYSAACPTFNCIQRVHQNTLESLPMFLVLLLLGGLYAPKISAAGGLIWLGGRIMFAKGYYTGDPSKRHKGVFGYAGLFLLLGTTVLFAVQLLYGWV